MFFLNYFTIEVFEKAVQPKSYLEPEMEQIWRKVDNEVFSILMEIKSLQ